ncbi:carbohydrate ABC transporter permease [Cellulomonas sp. NPDC089187]|uniref:carbohydrate ABC transporter permease n=1 Tax=Cellulomonas sp. NPDC089187 TaxID=3154970 RepID=UPI0034306F70
MSAAREYKRSGFWRTLTLALLVVIWLVPLVAVFVTSFRTTRQVSSSGWWEALIPPFAFTGSNYEQVLTRSGLAQAFLNSATITIPVVVLAVVFAALGGYVFARWRFWGRDVVFFVMLALLSVPLQMTLVPTLKLFGSLGIVGTFPAVWIAHLGYAMPFSVYLMRNFFRGVPEELFEAASIDGASEPRKLWSLGLPLATPALAAVGVFQFMWVWNDLLVALVFLGGGRSVGPLTVTVSNLVGAKGDGWEVLTAAAFILMLVPMIVFFALQKYFVRGLLSGSVK